MPLRHGPVDLLDRLSLRIDAMLAERDRVLVGIDGPDAAGKTTLADRLAERLGCPTVRASVDGFHHPRDVRRRRGPLSAEGYRDSFDVRALVDRLLVPFAAGAHQVVVQTFDHRVDAAAEMLSTGVPDRATLVVDGVFLLRPTIRPHWTLSIYLQVSPEESLRRALIRDVQDMGSTSEVERRYRGRYLPGQALYRGEADPLGGADIVVDNDEPSSPWVARW